MKFHWQRKGEQASGSMAIVYLLAGSVGLMMTGLGIILPIFARRFEQFGAGVDGLSIVVTAFALAQLLFAPLMGALADRYGRRPVMLLALAAFALANIGFVFADSIPEFIMLRIFEGALTAGLFPAAMGAASDITGPARQARGAGVIAGFFEGGMIFGPVLGGLLFDTYGYEAPFIASAAMAGIALLFTFLFVPETNRRVSSLRRHGEPAAAAGEPQAPALRGLRGVLASLPRPLTPFIGLCVLYFGVVFSWNFVAPELTFFVYDDLQWSSLLLGLFMGAYGLLSMFTQTLFGGTSDRWGRKPVILIGTFLSALIFFAVAFSVDAWIYIIFSAFAGFGIGLMYPALAASVLDLADPRHKSRVMGVAESSALLGAVLGPLTLVLFTGKVSSQMLFLTSGVITLTLTLFAALVVPRKTRESASAEPRHDEA